MMSYLQKLETPNWVYHDYTPQLYGEGNDFIRTLHS